MIEKIKELINKYWLTIYDDEWFDKDRDLTIVEFEDDVCININFKIRKEMYLKYNNFIKFKQALKDNMKNYKITIKSKLVKPKFKDYEVIRIDSINLLKRN